MSLHGFAANEWRGILSSIKISLGLGDVQKRLILIIFSNKLRTFACTSHTKCDVQWGMWRKNGVEGVLETDFLENCDKKLDRKAQLLYLACPFPDNLSTTKEKSCVPYLYVKENRSIAL